MKFYVLIFATTFLLIGCSHTTNYSDFNQINIASNGRDVDVSTIWGNTLPTENFFIDSDSVHWIDPKSKDMRSAPINSIHEIQIINRKRGAWEGYKAIQAGGIVFGSLLYLSGDDPPDYISFEAEQKFVLGILSGTISGAIFGLPLGAYTGSRDIYVINEVPQIPDATKAGSEE